eukprot:UN19281
MTSCSLFFKPPTFPDHFSLNLLLWCFPSDVSSHLKSGNSLTSTASA